MIEERERPLETHRSRASIALAVSNHVESITDAMSFFDFAQRRAKATRMPWIVACLNAPVMAGATVFFYLHTGFPYGFFWMGLISLSMQATYASRRHAQETLQIATASLLSRAQEGHLLVNLVEHAWHEEARHDRAMATGLLVLKSRLIQAHHRTNTEPLVEVSAPPPEPRSNRDEALPFSVPPSS